MAPIDTQTARIAAQIPDNSTVVTRGCPYCGAHMHTGMCPRIKAIEYYPNGSIKKVELKDG